MIAKFLDKKILGIRIGRILTFIGCLSASVLLWLIVRYLDENPDEAYTLISIVRGSL